MAHALRHDEALSRHKVDYAIFEIDEKPPVEHEKEFVYVFVFMPVVFALNDCHSDDCIVHLAKRLVVPFVGARIQRASARQSPQAARAECSGTFYSETLLRVFSWPFFTFNFLVIDSFFTVEIIGFLTFDNDAIGG